MHFAWVTLALQALLNSAAKKLSHRHHSSLFIEYSNRLLPLREIDIIMQALFLHSFTEVQFVL